MAFVETTVKSCSAFPSNYFYYLSRQCSKEQSNQNMASLNVMALHKVNEMMTMIFANSIVYRQNDRQVIVTSLLLFPTHWPK